MNGIHHLLGDVMLPMGFIGLGAPKDHEAMLSLRKLGVFHQDAFHWVTGP
jgi:hypothetical protein